jgi:steroid delta-isomerase-like uncharacterized protein
VEWGKVAIAVALVAVTGFAAGAAQPPAPVRAQEATPAACPVTTPEENKALVRNYWDEVYNQHNPDAVERYLADDFVRNNLARPQANEPGNDDDIRRAAENLVDFPDIDITVENVIADGDMVAARITWRGTQSDTIDQWHAPATGKPTTFAVMAMYRVACGKLAEQWIVLDYLSMLRELGIITNDELATIGSAAAPATPVP